MTTFAGVRRGLDQANTVARYELYRYTRSWRLTAMVGLVVAWALAVLGIRLLLGPAFPASPQPASLELARLHVTFVPFIAVGVALLFASDALVKEFTSKTGYVVLPNPVSRTTVLSGKFLASVAASWFVLLVYYVVTVALSWAMFQWLAADILASYIYAILFTLSILAFAYLVSSVAPSVTAAMTAVFLLLAVIFPWVGERLRVLEIWNLVIITETGSVTVELLNEGFMPQSLVDPLITVGLYIVLGLVLAAGAFIYREG